MFDDYYAFRDSVVEALERDLLGPRSPDEVINDPPITRYITGILFPRDSEPIDSSQDVGSESPTADDVEGGDWDPAVSMSRVRYPSSMGLSFAVTSASNLTVEASAARYEPMDAYSDAAGEAGRDEGDDADASLGRRARPRHQARWRRIPLDLPPTEIDVSTPSAGTTRELEEGLSLFVRIRAADEHGRVSLTIILINDRTATAQLGRDADSYFQVSLRVRALDGAAAFVSRPPTHTSTAEADVDSQRLLYRNVASIASGHGTAVDWELDPADS